MEPRGCNRWQSTAIASGPEAQEQAKTVAVGCDQLPETFHGKGHVDATSLLLKRGSPYWLREKRAKSCEPEGVTSKC
jgi:hypothetical protein